MCIRYFCKSKNKLMTTFLGIAVIVDATAVVLANIIKDYLRNAGLKLQNMIGLGTDGANVLCGQNNSVFTILKADAPRLVLVKCVAHSLHLCCSKASRVLPDEVDFLCKEIYNWFARSSQRRAGYKETFNLININENVRFHNFIELSETRWLERANVMKVILEQWLELKTYFSNTARQNKDTMAKIISKMLTDSNFIYFTIIHNIIIQVNVVNAAFQQTNGDAYQLYLEVYRLLLSMLRIVIKPIFLENLNELKSICFKRIAEILDNELSYIPLDVIDFGYKYRKALADTKLNLVEVESIKEHCRQFILTLCREFTKRLPSNMEVFISLKYFSPEFCLKLINRPNVSLLPLNFLSDDADKQILENEWNNLLTITWNETNISSEDFWIKVAQYKNAGGVNIFTNIAELAMTALSLSISNAFVERMFSFLNILKTKLRNRMSVSLLEALLRIKTEFIINNSCCNSFVPTEQMYAKFNYTMYNFKNQKDQETEEKDELFETFPNVQF